uniref:Uncharacterized protein n=1 Tax=Arundo donax TaxID=35708 RepID=A0A0A9BUC6_ARUDO
MFHMITSSSCGLQLISFKLYINIIQHFPKNMNQEYEKITKSKFKGLEEQQKVNNDNFVGRTCYCAGK